MPGTIRHLILDAIGAVIVFALPFLFFFGRVAVHEILHIIIIDYIPFILLLWALYAVSGGIYVRGSLKGTPVVNMVILLIGTILASVIGISPVCRGSS